MVVNKRKTLRGLRTSDFGLWIELNLPEDHIYSAHPTTANEIRPEMPVAQSPFLDSCGFKTRLVKRREKAADSNTPSLRYVTTKSIRNHNLKKSNLLFDGFRSAVPRLVEIRNAGTRGNWTQPVDEIVLQRALGVGHVPDARKDLLASSSFGF